jgi:hypothetical protein
VIMDAIGLAVAEALPVTYRGAYRDAASFPDASGVLRDLRA